MLYDSFCAIWKNKEYNKEVRIASILPAAVWYWLLCLLAVHFERGHLSGYNYTDFFTTSIMNMGASLISIHKLTDSLSKNSHIIIYEICSNSFSKQIFFSRRLPALTSSSAYLVSFVQRHWSCLLERSVNQLASLAVQDIWMRHCLKNWCYFTLCLG